MNTTCRTPHTPRAAALNAARDVLSNTRKYAMNRMTRRTATRATWTLVVPILALLAMGTTSGIQAQLTSPSQAQVTPTPEGTVIINEATVRFTDANGNSYADETASVSVTVGFQGMLDVIGQADVAPAANSNGNTLDFTLTNNGNGSDTLSVTAVTTANGTSVVDNRTYRISATDYADLAALNAALATLEVTPGNSVVVTVVYDVVAGSGGLDDDITLSAGSLRTGGDADTDAVNVAPPLGGAISITDPADQQRLPDPSGAQSYSITFPVTSTLSGTDNLDLVAALDGTNAAGVSITSVDGTAGSSTTLTFTAGETRNITVVYSVADNAEGAVSDLTLTATATSGPTASETAQIEIVRPDLTITKAVFTDAATSVAVSGDVFPGQTLYYRISVTNNGSAAASGVTVTDDLDEQLVFVGVTNVSSFWDSLTESGGLITATEASIPVGTTGSFVIEVTVR